MRPSSIILIGLLGFVGCTTGNQKSIAPPVSKADTSHPVKIKGDSIKTLYLTKAQKDSAAADSMAQDKISDTLFGLPEIKKFAKQLDSESHDSIHAEIIIDLPTPDDPYYFAHVGCSNNNSYHTQFSFYVKMKGKKVNQIIYYDVVKDTSVTLSVWRHSKLLNN